MPHAETLKKLQDENMAMREEISELKFEVGLKEVRNDTVSSFLISYLIRFFN